MAILHKVQYDAETVERVGSLLRKERLKADPDVQLLEDVICLVFLEYYLVDFASKHAEEKLLGVLRKTWRKMSETGHRAALALYMPVDLRAVVERAITDE